MADIVVTTTPTLLAAAKSSDQRGSVTLELRRAETVEVRVGIDDAAVTTSTGRLLARGFGMTIENDVLSKPATKAIYGIVASGTATVRVHELAP
jgi:hypothetical protein